MSDDIEKLILDLVSANNSDDEVFHRLINKSMQVLELIETDISRPFSCSTTSIKRWIEGHNAPHPAVRLSVYKLLIKLAEDRLAKSKIDEVVVIGC